MNVDRNKIKELLFLTIDEVNQQLLPQQRIEKSDDTVLLGSFSQVDSMGLINILVGLEGRLSNELGVNINITGEEAFSLENSPFYTVRTLIDYSLTLIDASFN